MSALGVVIQVKGETRKGRMLDEILGGQKYKNSDGKLQFFFYWYKFCVRQWSRVSPEGNQDKQWKFCRRITSVPLHMDQQQQLWLLTLAGNFFFFLPLLEKMQPSAVFFFFFWKWEKRNSPDERRGENKAAALCLGADAIYFALGHLGKWKGHIDLYLDAAGRNNASALPLSANMLTMAPATRRRINVALTAACGLANGCKLCLWAVWKKKKLSS